MGSPELLYERNNPDERALVVRITHLSQDLASPGVEAIINRIGLTPAELYRLLTCDLNPANPLVRVFSVYSQITSLKIDDVVDMPVITSAGPAVISDNIMYSAVVAKQDNQSFHLKTGKFGGFEIIYVQFGNAVLEFPEFVEPVAAGVYHASERRDNIFLIAGDVIFIQAPTANTWSRVEDGFRFRYVCQPPWDRSLLARVFD